jgi:hypothetical protein
MKNGINKIEQIISHLPLSENPEKQNEQLTEINHKLSEIIKQKDIFPIKNLIVTNTNKLSKYIQERDNRIDELLMESMSNLFKTIEEKQNHNEAWENDLNKTISLILNKPTISYQKDFDAISNKILTCSHIN